MTARLTVSLLDRTDTCSLGTERREEEEGEEEYNVFGSTEGGILGPYLSCNLY